MSVLSDLQRSAELNRRAFAACRRALTMCDPETVGCYMHSCAEGVTQNARLDGRHTTRQACPACQQVAAIKAARTSMAKAERGVSRES